MTQSSAREMTSGPSPTLSLPEQPCACWQKAQLLEDRNGIRLPLFTGVIFWPSATRNQLLRDCGPRQVLLVVMVAESSSL